jgi:uncharacterized protein (TIGR01244 family)
VTALHLRIAPLLLWTLLAGVPALAGQATATQTAPAPGDPSAAPAVEALLPNARRPAPNLLTGGQPSAEQLEALAAAGYTTIVDLRTEGEKGAPSDEPERVEALGLSYVRIPVTGAAGLTEEKARELDAVLDSAAGPAVVHCGSGNRVGALLALRAHLDGATPEAALEHGLDAGLTRFEPAVRELLGLAPAAPAKP